MTELLQYETDMYEDGSTEFLAMLEEHGVVFDTNALRNSFGNPPVARWLMERVQWQGNEAVLRNCISTTTDRSLIKTLLLEADKSGQPFKWAKYVASYLPRFQVDAKVVKWLVKEQEGTCNHLLCSSAVQSSEPGRLISFNSLFNAV